MKNSNSEENYLKAVFYLTYKSSEGASTSALANRLKTQASSVTDMLKKLSEKGLLNYKKYQGAILTAKGKRIAIEIIRKHRLWEFFLVELSCGFLPRLQHPRGESGLQAGLSLLPLGTVLACGILSLTTCFSGSRVFFRTRRLPPTTTHAVIHLAPWA